MPKVITICDNLEEAEQLVSQNVIPHKKYFGGSLPYDFFGKKRND